jgi:hypothetical protein
LSNYNSSRQEPKAFLRFELLEEGVLFERRPSRPLTKAFNYGCIQQLRGLPSFDFFQEYARLFYRPSCPSDLVAMNYMSSGDTDGFWPTAFELASLSWYKVSGAITNYYVWYFKDIYTEYAPEERLRKQIECAVKHYFGACDHKSCTYDSSSYNFRQVPEQVHAASADEFAQKVVAHTPYREW